jgi:hypothetical protein
MWKKFNIFENKMMNIKVIKVHGIQLVRDNCKTK